MGVLGSATLDPSRWRVQLQLLEQTRHWIATQEQRAREQGAAPPPVPAPPVRERIAYTPLKARSQ
ncbi:hypothetical protein [Streptomyces albipurpureus]|uniref:Integrase n=1 Tax=Streptomyces albipurpureus TaxID=2897419 RepID=A0ABT0USY4_9ACTN|nr:hypothetical protein [Streptomyces sp. CWNU-1]MCM2390730.1 hypothetical protein [Streptomyces sp. CWNU-1]